MTGPLTAIVEVRRGDGVGPETDVLGLPLLWRPLLALAEAGFSRVVVVGDADERLLRGRVACRLEIERSTSVDSAVASAGGRAVVVPGDLAVHPADLRSLAAAAESGTVLLGDTGARSVAPGQGERVVATAKYWSRARSTADLAAMRDGLVKALRKPVEIDGAVGYYIMRPVTLRLTRLLVHTPVRPNHVTALTMLLGLAGAALVATSGYAGALLGAALYFAGATLDCCDGEIARLKFLSSNMGQWFDTASDDISTASFMAAMAVHLERASGSPFWLWWGLTGTALFVIASVYVYRGLLKYTSSGDLLDFPWTFDTQPSSSSGIMSIAGYAFKRDFFSLFFLLCAAAGCLEAASVFAALGGAGYFAAACADGLQRVRGRT